MREPVHNTAKLPRQLLEDLRVAGDGYDRSRKKRGGPTSRKESRKAARVQKKTSNAPSKAGFVRQRSSDNYEGFQSKASTAVVQPKNQALSVQPKIPESIMKVAKAQPTKPEGRVRSRELSPSPPPPPKISRGVKEKLAKDDAEIAALERALGVKGNKKLPKPFEEDGLDSLLEGIDDTVGFNEGWSSKRKRSEGEVWLERKRQKAKRNSEAAKTTEGLGSSEASEEGDGNTDSDLGVLFEDREDLGDTDTDAFDGFDTSDEENGRPLPKSATKRTRENPYVAPITWSGATEPGKYVPPSRRIKDSAGLEDFSQLRRQIQGLLNRLSEANIISILGVVETLYQNNPRQNVTTTLLDLLMGLLSDPSHLQNTFIILHAGFIAALYKVVGTDFGAQVIQRIDKDFNQNYQADTIEEGPGKKLVNLVSLLSELYNFQVIGSNLIYDYIRHCLDDLSETNTELLLKVIRNAGQQLRQDDPSSLKDIIIRIQATVAKTGEGNLSMRTKYMIETINDLKNNRMKTGVAASTVTSEHTIRMKKTLGSLNTRSLKASEPLRIGMEDLRDRDKVGPWWLVGAGYKGNVPKNDELSSTLQANQHKSREEENPDSYAADLVELAKEQRMNTDVRRSIFISIMSSTDFNDAYVRLMKLRLKRAQELEIPKVLIHCAGAEKVYNPFYTFLSRRLCSDKKLKMSFQFCLWDLFKQMGEGDDERDEQGDEGKNKLVLRSLVNLAKMYGVLIAEGGLTLDILKTVKFAFLQPQAQTFVEILFIAAILHSQHGSEGHKNEKALLDMFLKPKQISEMASGMRYFLKKVVRKTDVAGRSHYDIIVVGAGLQGLVAAKTFLQLNPDSRLLIIDFKQSLGGVWAKEKLYPGLNSNNLVGTYEYTDFPMDETFGVKHPEHIPGEVIHEYFRQYAEKFDLVRRTGMGTKVTVAEKVDEGWKLRLETVFTKPEGKGKGEIGISGLTAQRIITCAKLVVATGLTSSPQPINIKGSDTFGAPIVNFGDYACHAQLVYDDRSIRHVTVYGGGKASYDIVYSMATHGKRVDWIFIRASGHGPTYMAPAHISIGPFKCWLEKLTTMPPLTWFSPCVWGDADGFGYLRKWLHETNLGRWLVEVFWHKLGSDLIAQTHIVEHEETKKLIPDQAPLWYGTNLSILNYPTDIYSFVRKGQVKVIRKDVRCLDGQKTILFEDDSSIRTDALICSMGWKFTPTIDFRPKEIHADLGIPSAHFSKPQRELWEGLDARADVEIFKRFPKLQAGVKMDQDSLVGEQVDLPRGTPTKQGKPRKEVTPWRLWRGIAPSSLGTRDLVFLGNVLQLQGAVRSEISSIWAYAYMYDKLTEPLVSVSKPSVPLHLNSEKAERDKILYDTALFNRFGKWRTPYGFGARHPDVVFDGVPYFDLLLQDLGLNNWRKG